MPQTIEITRTKRRAAVALLALGMPLLLLACAKTEPAGAPVAAAPGSTTAASVAEGVTVTIKDFAFGPKSVKIKAGQTVTFRNSDTAPHEPSEGTPGKKGPTFDVPTAGGESDTTPGLQPGTYPYYCALHEYMKGEIVVE